MPSHDDIATSVNLEDATLYVAIETDGTQTVFTGHFSFWRSGKFVQRDAKHDFDLPSSNEDLLDHEPQQPLSSREVETVDVGDDLCRKTGYPFAQVVLTRQFLVLGNQCILLFFQ